MWETLEAAKAFFSGPWLDGIRERYRIEPRISYFETFAVADAKHGVSFSCPNIRRSGKVTRMTKPCALLFDTFGTIVDWRTSLIDELTAFGLKRGIHADWTGLVDAWREAYVPSMDKVRQGQRPWTKLDDLHRATLDRLVEKFGITGLSEAEPSH